MPTEELQKALRSANITNVEKDFVDLLCKMFDAPRPLVLRLMYAVHYGSSEYISHATWINAEELPSNLREAIGVQLKAGWARVRLRRVIENEEHALAWVESMISENDAGRMCDGCPKSLECVAESLHRPEDCRVGKGAWARTLEVRPTKINKDKVTVECEHPRGTFVLDVKDFDL